MTTPLINRQRVLLLAALVTFFTSVYMLTYSGRIESGDSLSLFDATGSLVQFGDTSLDISAWFNPPRAFNQIGQFYPLQKADAEPLSMILAMPLYGLAYHLPGIGLVHAVWLFNIFVSAAAVGVFFLFALAQGYKERTAIVGAFVLGLGTIIWPYSKSFFRDPLLMLLLLITGLLIERWRTGEYRSRLLLTGIVGGFVGAVLTKESAVFALPGLLVIAVPTLKWDADQRRQRLEIVALILIGILVLIVAFVNLGRLFFGLFSQLPQTTRLAIIYIQTAIHAYLFSIGGSFWGTSPVLLLALPGPGKLWRKEQHRYIWAGLLLLVVFALGHAALRQEHWFGGLSWPPRFLVPVIPFLLLLALPILDHVVHGRVPRWVVIAAGLLFLYGVWVQLSGVSLWWGEYAGALPPESGQVIEWGGGLNQLPYLRWVITPGMWSSHPLDFAWVRVGTPVWVIIFGVIGVVSAGVLVRSLRSKHPSRQSAWVVAALPIAFVLSSWVGLRMIYIDEMYLGSNPSLHSILPIIEAETRPGDVVVLTSNRYERFFSNYAKLSYARVTTLAPQPGEQPSPEQAAQIISDNTDLLLTNLTVPFLHVLASTRDRLWILADSGPFIPWSVRPVERFMAAHYYPIREVSADPADPEVRLIEYSTVSAPDPFAFRGPENLTDLIFGDSLRLAGYDLPSGTVYQPGQALPVSFYWQATTPITRDYTVAWFVADMNDAVIAQGMDSYPGGGFEHTSQWQIGVPKWDNRALWLPADLPIGSYRLWVKVYTYDGAIQDLNAVGETVIDDTIGVLPTIIEVSQ